MTIIKKLGLLFLTFMLLLAYTSVLFPQETQALAGVSDEDVTNALYNFRDVATIEATIGGNKVVFTDSKPFDNNHNYLASSGSTCSDDITIKDDGIFDVNANKVGSTTATIKYRIVGTMGCGPEKSTTIQVGKLDLAKKANNIDGLQFISNLEISSSTTGNPKFKRAKATDLVLKRSDEKAGITGASSVTCQDLLFLDTASGPGLMIELDIGNSGVKVTDLQKSSDSRAKALARKIIDANSGNSGCRVQRINGADVNNQAEVAGLSMQRMNVADSSGSGSGEGDDDMTCDAAFQSVMSWIICPAIEFGISITDKMFSDLIQPLMEDVPITANPADRGYQAWAKFRLLGNIILVGTLIAVVYAQVRGGKN